MQWSGIEVPLPQGEGFRVRAGFGTNTRFGAFVWPFAVN